MFLKQEKSEIEDFERRQKILVLGNILKNVQVFNGYPCKKFTKYFCLFFCFRTF